MLGRLHMISMERRTSVRRISGMSAALTCANICLEHATERRLHQKLSQRIRKNKIPDIAENNTAYDIRRKKS